MIRVGGLQEVGRKRASDSMKKSNGTSGIAPPPCLLRWLADHLRISLKQLLCFTAGLAVLLAWLPQAPSVLILPVGVVAFGAVRHMWRSEVSGRELMLALGAVGVVDACFWFDAWMFLDPRRDTEQAYETFTFIFLVGMILCAVGSASLAERTGRLIATAALTSAYTSLVRSHHDAVFPGLWPVFAALLAIAWDIWEAERGRRPEKAGRRALFVLLRIGLAACFIVYTWSAWLAVAAHRHRVS